MTQSNLTFTQKCGILLIFATGPGMALLQWSTPYFHAIPLLILLMIAAVGGAEGMALLAPRPLRMIGMFCGILIGLGSFALHSYYSSFRSEMHNYESTLIGMLGALPGILLYAGLRQWKIHRLSAESSDTSGTPDTDLADLRDDPMFVRNTYFQDAALLELKKRLLLIGCAATSVMLTVFLVLLFFSLSELSEVRTMPKCTVVSYAQFIKDHPHTGWFQIKDCLLDLREAVYTLTPPEGNDSGGQVSYVYIPIHGGAGSREANTQLVVTPANSVASTLYSQVQEIAAIRKSHPTDAAEVLNAQPDRFLLKRDIQGTLATGATLYQDDALKKLASCHPPLSHDYVVLTDGDNPSRALSGTLSTILLSGTLCAVTLPLFVFLLRQYRKIRLIS